MTTCYEFALKNRRNQQQFRSFLKMSESCRPNAKKFGHWLNIKEISNEVENFYQKVTKKFNFENNIRTHAFISKPCKLDNIRVHLHRNLEKNVKTF